MHFGILGLYVFSGFQFLYNQSNDDAFPLSSIFIIFCHIRVSSKSNGLVMLWKRTWMQSRTSFGLRDGFGKKIESLVFVCGSEALLDLNVNWIWFSSFFFLYLWPFTAIIVVHSSYENHHKWPNVKKRDMKKIIGFHLCSILFGIWIINFGQPNSSLIWLLNEGRQLHKKKKKGRIQKSYFRQKAKNALKHFVSLPIYM